MTDGPVRRALLRGARSDGWPQLVRFGMAGLMNAGFGYLAFAALLLAGAGALAALVVATVAGVAFNFQTSRRLVFRSRGRVWRFIAVYASAFAFNWVALRALASFGLSDLLAQALLTLPVAAVSFVGQRLFVFGPTPRQA